MSPPIQSFFLSHFRLTHFRPSIISTAGCCLCCLASHNCGCCCCFGVFSSSIIGLTGASIPSCCKKNTQGLCLFGGLSAGALLIRLIIVIAVAAIIGTLNQEIEDYDKCCDNPPYSPDSGYYCWPGSNEHYDWCGDKHLSYGWRRLQKFVVHWFTISMVLVIIMMLFSLMGTICGFVGCNAEKEAEENAPAEAAGSPQVVTGSVQLAAGYGAVFVDRGRLQGVQPQVTVVTAAPAPAARDARKESSEGIELKARIIGVEHVVELNFEPSATYSGSRDGFVFKRGSRGVGYYRDSFS